MWRWWGRSERSGCREIGKGLHFLRDEGEVAQEGCGVVGGLGAG